MALIRPHIALSYEGPIPLEFLEEFRTSTARDRLELLIDQRPSTRAMAGIDWVMPTAIMAFVTGAYFSGFLNEMGKEHYHALKGAIKTLGERLNGLRYVRVATQGKLSAQDLYSPIYSIWTDRDAKTRFKFLVPNGLSADELAEVLDAYMAFLEAWHTDGLPPKDRVLLADARPMGGVVLLAYSLADKSMKLIDPLTPLHVAAGACDDEGQP